MYRNINTASFCNPDCTDLLNKIPLQVKFVQQLVNTLVTTVNHLQANVSGSGAVTCSILTVISCLMAYVILNKNE
jgi:hypothetical protein